MSLPKGYDDFGEVADDCFSAGNLGETSYKVTTKIPSGESISVTQKIIKKTAEKNANGVVTDFAFKFGKGSGLKLDKFSASTSNTFKAAGSYSGLLPDLKVDLNAKCNPTKTPLLQSLCLGFHYTQKDSLLANLNVTRSHEGYEKAEGKADKDGKPKDLGHSTLGKLDLLYAQSGAVIGGDIGLKYAEAKGKMSLDGINVKLGYTMDTTSIFVKSSGGLQSNPKNWTLQLHKQWSDVLGTALQLSTEEKTVTKEEEEVKEVSVTPEIGCKYALDSNTEIVGKMILGGLMPKALPKFQMLYSQKLSSVAKLNASFVLDAANPETLGAAMGFEFGDI